MWGLDEPARRGPKPALTITDIAAQGVAVADADGLAAVSMARVAKGLGFTTMSLYRYVESKDDLLVAMVDHAFGPPPDLARHPPREWRRGLTDWARASRDALLRHPWILQVPITEPPLAPHQTAWMEQGLQAMRHTGMSEQQKLSSMLLVDVFVRGQTQLTLGIAPPQASGGERPVDPYPLRLRQLVDDERFPAVTAALESGSLEDDTDFGPDEFEFGLTTLLDGIERLVERLADLADRRR
jgi:AcrR family transcriptional regulator